MCYFVILEYNEVINNVFVVSCVNYDNYFFI